ncbi:MAG TPA: hypothetical protein VNF47_11800 [Streptosporangiaceae bacterium]|nr:hypothetical protein [Streptosporangiaceae bacterium]
MHRISVLASAASVGALVAAALGVGSAGAAPARPDLTPRPASGPR